MEENTPMTGMATPDPSMETAPEETLTDTPAETPESKFDMETLMGNFMDLSQDERKIATRLLATPAPMIFDKIIGEPVMQRLIAQLDRPIEMGGPEETSPEGMMAPTTEEPMADMPTEEEEATPPV